MSQDLNDASETFDPQYWAQKYKEMLHERNQLIIENSQMRSYVTATVEWAQVAYHWECFWQEMNWEPKSAFDKNGKKLLEYIAQGKELLQWPTKS